LDAARRAAGPDVLPMSSIGSSAPAPRPPALAADSPDRVRLQDVRAAAERLRGVAHVTPVMTSSTLNAQTGAEVFLKCENFQRAGAFKFRGAYNALAQLTEEQRRAGVLTYSSGNHAQAVALSGKLLGVRTLVIMPATAPSIKRQATEGYGAEVLLYDPAREDREAIAERIQGARGMVLIPPFNHPHVIAGQGTAALELIGEVERLDCILAPCGGGGLLSGTAVAARGLLPAVRVLGVEPEGANNGALAFRAGRIVRVEQPRSMADGLMPKALGDLTFAHIRALVHDMLTVSEEELRAALFFLWNRMKLVVEPSGAAALAAVFHGKFDARGLRVGVILSGGNADLGAVADWFRAPRA
jgi:threonine dehydratase